MVLEATRGWGKELRVAYTNADGLMSVKCEIDEYLKNTKPDIMGVVETKLSDGIEMFNIGDGNYKVWTRNRLNKQGGGVMIMTKKNITVEEVVFGKGLAEILKVKIIERGGGKRDLAVAYVPPKTNAWSMAEYDEMLKDTEECYC